MGKGCVREGWEDCGYAALIVFCFLMRTRAGREEILLIRRANEPYKGEVTVPGGRKKRGESLSAACAREMLEETGYILKETKFAGVLHAYRDGDPMEYVSHYYVCRDFEGGLCASDEGELLWAGCDESMTLPGIHPFYTYLFPLIRAGRTVDGSVRIRAGERCEYGKPD